MLRTLCLALLLISSSLQAHSENDSLAHRAFWYSSNGNPVLDGNGNCIRNGSWAALGSPSCVTEAEPEVIEPTPEAKPEPEVAPAPAAKPETEAKPQPEPEPEPAATATEAPKAAAPEPVAPKAEPTAVAEPTPAPSPKPSPEPAAAEPEPVVVEAPVKAAEPEVVTYSYPVETVTASILFDFDKNNLRIDQQENIEKAIIQARKAHKIFKVSLDGHADSRGTHDYNYDLSQRRINTIVNYLNLRDIKTNSTMAWGETKLILNADGSENYDQSRRVEINIKVQQKVAN